MRQNKKFSAIWFFLRQYKSLYVTLLSVTIFYAVLESVNISIFVPLFNAVLGKADNSAAAFRFFEKMLAVLPFRHPVIGVLAIAITVSLVKVLFGFLRIRLVGYGVGEVVCKTKERIFDKFIGSDYQFFLDNKQGRLLYLIFTSTGKLGNCLQLLPDIVTGVLMAITIGVILFFISFRLTVVLLFLGVLYGVLMNFLAKKVSYNIGKERIIVDTNRGVVANEMIDGIKHIKVANAAELWRNKFAILSRRLRDLVIRDYFWSNIPDVIIQMVPVLALICMALFLYVVDDPANFLIKNMVPMGVYIYAFYRLSPYLTSLGKLRMQFTATLPDVELLYDTLNQETNNIEDGKLEINDIKSAIRFKDVSFSYKGKKEILNKVSFDIEKGKTTAIVGVSGSGKTTLINLLVRLFDADEGTITIDGVNLRDIKISSLMNLIGMVSQDAFIFNASIRENIIFGLGNVSKERLIEAAKQANAHEYISHFPSGYDTIVGDKGLKLSGGQRQRIAIARAILRNSKILILDEATSSLDSHAEVAVQKAINEASKDRTVIVIAHRLSTVVSADKIIVLDRGGVAEEGSHEDLLRRAGVYNALYEVQQKGHGGYASKVFSDE